MKNKDKLLKEKQIVIMNVWLSEFEKDQGRMSKWIECIQERDSEEKEKKWEKGIFDCVKK